MAPPTSRLAYIDCYKILDAALEDKLGVRVRTSNEAQAQILRSRLHYARRLIRDENLAVYNPGDPLFGRSPYDVLVIRFRDAANRPIPLNYIGEVYVYVEQRQAPGEIEPLAGEAKELPPVEEPVIEDEETEPEPEPAPILRRL